MGLLDGIFDFDRDGKTDFTENVVGTALAALMLDDATEEERSADLSITLSFSMGDSNAEEAEEDETSWRNNYAYDDEIDVDPDDYDDEEEYLEAVEDAAWKRKYVHDCDAEIDPDDYDDEEEYLEAVEASKWKRKYEYDCDTGIDPDDYDTEEEYLEELQDARDSLMGKSGI